jgi:hypothetical protein
MYFSYKLLYKKIKVKINASNINKLKYVNPLKPKLFLITFKDSVLTSKKTQPVTIKKIKWLMLFKEKIAVYSDKHIKE